MISCRYLPHDRGFRQRDPGAWAPSVAVGLGRWNCAPQIDDRVPTGDCTVRHIRAVESRTATAGARLASMAAMRKETPDLDVIPIRRDPLPAQWAVVAGNRLIAIVGERKDAVAIAFRLAYHCDPLRTRPAQDD